MHLKFSEIKNIIKSGIDKKQIKRLKKMKRLTPRNPIYWLHFHNMTLENAIFSAKRVTPGTFEYFKYYKNILNDEDARTAMNKYNKDRACTKENFIQRHGEIEGLKKWEAYCQRQSYAGITLSYFIETYGSEIGRQMYNSMLSKKLKSFGKAARHSKPCQELIKEIVKFLPETDIIWHADHPRKEWKIKTEFDMFTKTYFYDFFNQTTGKIIEFNGDFWHGNPRIYKADDLINYPGKSIKIKVSELWQYDEDKRNIAMLHPDIKEYLVIWEKDWYEDREGVIEKCKQFLNG